MYAIKFKHDDISDYHFCIENGKILAFDDLDVADEKCEELQSIMNSIFPDKHYHYELVRL